MCTQNIGKEFGWENCATLILKSGKGKIWGKIRRSNQERITTLREKDIYK